MQLWLGITIGAVLILLDVCLFFVNEPAEFKTLTQILSDAQKSNSFRPPSTDYYNSSSSNLLLSRGSVIKSKCKKYKTDTKNSENPLVVKKELTWEMVLEPKYNLFACAPLRASSGTINRLWFHLHQDKINHELKFEFAQREKLTKFPRNMSAEKVLEMAENMNNTTYSFMVVRHPIARFYSAYKLKFKIRRHKNRRKRSHQPLIGWDLLKDSGISLTTIKQKYSTRKPDFGFSVHEVDVINAMNDYKTHFNTHFKTQKNQCKPCFMNYDRLVRLETFQQDMKIVLDELGIEDAFVRARVLEGRNRGRAEEVYQKNAKLIENFNKLPEDTKVKFFDFYAEDFDMFGYSKSSINYTDF